MGQGCPRGGRHALSWASPHVVHSSLQACPAQPCPRPGPCPRLGLQHVSPRPRCRPDPPCPLLAPCPLHRAWPNVKTLLPTPRPQRFSEVSPGAARYLGVCVAPELVPGWPSRHGPLPASHLLPRLQEEQEGITGSLEPDKAVEAGCCAPHRVPRPWHFSPWPHGILNRQGPQGEAWGMSSDIAQLQALKPSDRSGLVPGGQAHSQLCTLTVPAPMMA